MVVPPQVGELKKYVTFFAKASDAMFGSSGNCVSTRYMGPAADWK